MNTKEVHVKAHCRVIKEKTYRFICRECNRSTNRKSFGGRPIYCESCRPPISPGKLQHRLKKKPRAMAYA